MLTVCSSSMHTSSSLSDDPQSEMEFAESWKVIRQRHFLPTNQTLIFMPKC